MLKKEVDTPEGIVYLIPGKEGVIVEDDFGEFSTTIDWSEFNDIPLLMEKFGEMKVKVFRPVVEQLGVMYSNRELYKGLIE